jgi:hypothetical protein
MSFSNTFETTVLKWTLTTDSVTRPTTWYLGLFTSDPTDAGTGTEVSGNGYTRKAVTFSVTGDTATNTAAIEFDAATASWGTVTHVAVFDASTSGNMIVHSALTTSKAVSSGDILRVPAGDLDITLD